MTNHSMPPTGTPNVFTIPPGAPFLDTFVDALLDGRLVPGYSRNIGPLGLAGATIYVPTRRSARALAATFAERIGGQATLLPQILPLGGLDALEPGLLLDDAGFDMGLAPDLPVAIGDIARRMILTRLILGWGQAVRHAIVAVDVEGRRETHGGEALLVATTPADAWHLSGELAALLDELIIEDVSWHAMRPLGTEAFDRYWGITLDFLNIAVEHWPAILVQRGQVDGATRQARLIEAEIARLRQAAGRNGPVIVAGSTGSNAATGRLIAAVARLPAGAVILPGLDQNLDNETWESIRDADFAAGSAAGHAQAALHRILPIIGITRQDVVALGQPSPALAARSRFVSEALRPAETTDGWHAIVTGAFDLDVASALAGVTVIEAADEREEALALAIALRETLEGPGSAVLVTPDRTLARRVREELARWNIEIDDSGGEALSQTSAGTLARLVLDCALRELAPVDVLALLAHPAVRLGRPRVEIEGLSRRAELTLLRGVVPSRALYDPAQLVARARRRAGETHAPASLRSLTEEDCTELEEFLAGFIAALAPLHSLGAGVPLPQWLAAHEDVLSALVRTERDESALRGSDGTRLATLFDDLIESAEPSIALDCPGYAALFDRFASETPVRGPARSHPRLKILGPLEARLLSADRILLGGLDEMIWPPQVQTGAFLNRPMRAALGLSPPERRIGQSAHDFEMALGQRDVIISRSAKRAGAPTVPSRFLQRMAAVAGKHWHACTRRGQRTLDLARALDKPVATTPIRRPAPKPPLDLRPNQLSVTRIELLRRDPYAIHAERILRLKPLDEIDAELGPAEWGTAFHAVLSGFVETFPRGPLPPAAIDTLLQRVRETFADMLHDPTFRAFMGPRLDHWAHGFFAWEQARRPGIATIHVEERGTLAIPLDDGSVFTLTASADRIETDVSGGIRIIDFKTGAAPSKKEVLVGFAPQLTLEAAMAARGAFTHLATHEAAEGALYVKFGTDEALKVTSLDWKDRAFADVVAEHYEGLRDLLNDFRAMSTGYIARPYPQFLARYSDYDHLSRVKEWSATGAESAE